MKKDKSILTVKIQVINESNNSTIFRHGYRPKMDHSHTKGRIYGYNAFEPSIGSIAVPYCQMLQQTSYINK